MNWQISPWVLVVVAGVVVLLHLVRLVKLHESGSFSRMVIWGGLCVTYLYVATSPNVMQSSQDFSRALGRVFALLLGLDEVGCFVVRMRMAGRKHVD